MHLAKIGAAFVVAFFLPLSALAQSNSMTVDEMVRLTETLEAFAQTTCESAPAGGRSSSFGVEGQGSVGLSKILPDIVEELVDAGVEGAVKYQREEYIGVLQSEIAAAMENTNNCRMRVLELMTRTLMNSPGSASFADPRVQTVALPGLTEFQYQNEYLEAAVMSISQSADGEWLNISFLIKNIYGEPLYLFYHDKSVSETIAFDDTGVSYRFKQISGIATNIYSNSKPAWTRIGAGAVQTVVLRLRGWDTEDRAKMVSFTINIYVDHLEWEPALIAVGMSNILVKH